MYQPRGDGSIRSVLLVDGHDISRRGISDLLQAETDIKVIGEAATATEAFASVGKHRPEVVILNSRLPDAAGAQLCRDISRAYPEVRCLVLAADSDDSIECLMSGASGYLLQNISAGTLSAAVRATAEGIGVWGKGVADPMRATLLRENSLGMLTSQERRILNLVGRGLTNREVASELGVSDKTVKNHVSALIKKLGLRSRVDAASYVRGAGSGALSA